MTVQIDNHDDSPIRVHYGNVAYWIGPRSFRAFYVENDCDPGLDVTFTRSDGWTMRMFAAGRCVYFLTR